MKTTIKNVMLITVTTLGILGLAFIAMLLSAKPAYAATNITVKAGQVKTVKAPRNTKLIARNKKVVAVNNKKIMGRRSGKTQLLVKKNNRVVNKINVTVVNKTMTSKPAGHTCEPGCHSYKLQRKTVIDSEGYTETMTMAEFEQLAGKSFNSDQEYIQVTHPEQSHEETYLECSKCHNIITK